MSDDGSQKIRVALPRGQELHRLVEHFGRVGFALEALAEDARFVEGGDPLDSGFDFEFVTLSPSDVGTYVEFGICHAGVLSTDLIGESEFKVWRPFTFNFGSYPLVLVGWRGQTLNTLMAKPVLRLATPIPRFTKEWFTTRGIPTEVVPVVNDASIAVILGLTDCWVDQLTNPEEVVAAGFRVVETMGQTYLKLVVNPAAASGRRTAIRQLISALEEQNPPPGPRISIPFDLDDPL